VKVKNVRIDPDVIGVVVTYGPDDYEQLVQIPVVDPDGTVTLEMVAEANEAVARILDEPSGPGVEHTPWLVDAAQLDQLGED
jgi:hypothetical protein